MADFTFLHPHWLLLIIPVLIGIRWLYLSKNRPKLIASHLMNALGLQQQNHKLMPIITATLFTLSLVAMAGPSFQKQSQPAFNLNHAKVLVMDMSMSLYANDIKPDRLTQSRYKALDLLSHWNEGSSGLVAYAGDAYVVSPLTRDSDTLSSLVPMLSPEIMPYSGSDAASGVKLAIEMMNNAGFNNGDIVLFSDDVSSNEKSQIEALLNGTLWRLSILAIGTENGAPIRLVDGSLLKNSSGNNVVAKTNMNNMQALTKQHQGQFMPIQLNNRDIKSIAEHTNNAIAQEEKSNQDEHSLQDNVNNGVWLLPLILFGSLLMFRRGVLFSVILPCLFSFSFLIPKPVYAATVQESITTSNRSAQKAYEQGDYQSAAELFDDLEWRAAAQYQSGNYQSAIDTFSQLSDNQTDLNVSSQYNLANAYAQAGELEAAAEIYQRILELDPTHSDAARNLQIVEQAKENQDQQSQNSEQSQDSENSDDPESEENQEESGSEDNPSDSENGDNEQQQDGEDSSESEEQSSESDSGEQAQEDQDPSEKEKSSESNKNENQSENEEQNQVSEQQEETPDTAEQKSNSQMADANLRKLEQIESSRDPNQLLRAQMILQAQQKSEPDNKGKTW